MSVDIGETDPDVPRRPRIGGATGRYLLAIHRLSTAGTDRVSTGALRRSLDVSAASVTEMTAKLGDRGFVDYEKYRGVVLTGRGASLAVGLFRRFCAVTTFFESELDVALDDETVCEIAVTLPRDAVFRLRELTDRPCLDECPETASAQDGCPV
ncbi:metal-dependent transcriptional regulator [Halosimplex salinum]|uniref:metal-dependent transcriptional regulator n=1 Tax=Halosimplex salinum TaxID=1710538 RepID=UPI0013DE2A80|nr:metal-dependent transcriptional regulator [Halosimplex salinum]